MRPHFSCLAVFPACSYDTYSVGAATSFRMIPVFTPAHTLSEEKRIAATSRFCPPWKDLWETPSPLTGEGRDGGEKGFMANYHTLPATLGYLLRIEYGAGFSPERRVIQRSYGGVRDLCTIGANESRLGSKSAGRACARPGHGRKTLPPRPTRRRVPLMRRQLSGRARRC